jgi:putative oxidoreductase
MGKFFYWFCRLALGGLFLYAASTKGLYPFREPFLFAIAISSYQMLPGSLIIFVSRALPWFEVALGIVLLLGWQLRWSAGVAALLLGAFIAAMTVTYARGIQADCGCFGLGEPISPLTLVRDSLIMAMAVFLTVRAWRRRSVPAPSAA